MSEFIIIMTHRVQWRGGGSTLQRSYGRVVTCGLRARFLALLLRRGNVVARNDKMMDANGARYCVYSHTSFDTTYCN